MRPGPYAEEPSVASSRRVLASSRRVLKATRQLAVAIGSDSFQAMATHLTQALEADCVWIGEFVPGPAKRVLTLAAFLEGESGSLTFDLDGSACARIAATGKSCLCHENAQKRFPNDQMLRRVNAQAFVGASLTNSAGVPVGAIMATYRTPVASLSGAKAVLDILAPRVSVELHHKQEVEQLLRREQRYRTFITQSADGLWRVEFEQPIPIELPEGEQTELAYKYGYFAECNAAQAHLLGRENAEQVVGRRIADIYPRTSPLVLEAFLNLRRSHYRFTTKEVSAILLDGQRHYLAQSLLGIVEDGLLQRVWGVSHDITLFKQVQRALDASEHRMVDLLEAIQVLVLISNPSGAVLYSNDHFSDLTGWQTADVKGKKWINLVIPAEERARVEAESDTAMGLSASVHFESTLVCADGRRRQIAWDSAGLRDTEGKVTAIANVGRDITQEKLLEAQLQQAQKLESIGRLVGGIAHDFNNLLTVICGYGSWLLDKLSPADPVYAGLNEMQNAAHKGAQLTHQLLAFSRRRVVHQEVLNLNTVLEENAKMLPRLLGDDVELVTNLDPSPALVRADAGQISQVILNLALNARDAMPRGGRLTIASSNVVLDVEHAFGAREVPPGEYVQLAVTDTGTGMTEEVRGRLFEPFFTTKEPGQGTGLGLATVYGIVQQSGGHLVVESAIDQGSTFHLFLPKAKPEPKLPEERETVLPRPRGTETILLVDDRPDVRTLTALMLRDLGYTVLEAAGPSQALEIVHSKVDLILADEIMPQMRGTELAEKIRASNPRVGILIMSGYIGSDQSHHFDPKFPFLSKPFTQQELALALHRALDSADSAVLHKT